MNIINKKFKSYLACSISLSIFLHATAVMASHSPRDEPDAQAPSQTSALLTETVLSDDTTVYSDENPDYRFFDAQQTAESQPTPSLEDIIESYCNADPNALYPGELLWRLIVELKNCDESSLSKEAYSDFLNQTLVKGLYATQFSVQLFRCEPESFYMFVDTIRDKSSATSRSRSKKKKIRTVPFKKITFLNKEQREWLQGKTLKFTENNISSVLHYFVTNDQKSNDELKKRTVLKMKISHQLFARKMLQLFDIKEKEFSFLPCLLKGNNKDMFDIALRFGNTQPMNAPAYKGLFNKFEECKIKAITGSFRAFFNLGVHFAQQKQFHEAEKWYLKAGTLDGEGALTNLGMLYQQHKHLTKTQECFEQTVPLGGPLSLANLGVLFSSQGETIKAEKCFRQSLKRQGNILAHGGLAFLLHNARKLDEAEKHYLEALKLESHATHLLLSLGRLYLEKGEVSKAESYCNKAIKHNCHQAYLLLALTLSDERAEEKEACFKKAVEYGVKHSDILYGEFLYNQGRYEEADEFGYIPSKTDSDSDSDSDIEETRDDVLEESDRGALNSDDTQETASKIPSEAVPTQPEVIVLPEQPAAYTPPKLSKRYKKQLERAKKAAMKPATLIMGQEKKPLTYENILMEIAPDAQQELEMFSSKIKSLLSYLANGEGNRGNLEALKGDDNLYAMRITRGDRLVFRITEGDFEKGVEKIRILSAKTHYATLSKRLKVANFKPFNYPK